MMKNEDFLSKIIQYIGAFFTIGTIISQYLFREEFRKMLSIGDAESFYNAFTIAGLILGLTIVIGLFANRHFLLSRIYLDKEKYKRYLEGARKAQKSTGQLSTESPEEIILEPFYLDGKRFALISFVFSIVFFISIFYFRYPLLKSIFYLLFLLTIIFSATIFLLLLYGAEDWKKREKETRELVLEKIRDYFALKFKIIERLEDSSNIFYPVTRMIIEVGGEKYLVVTDKNNPEKYFSVQPCLEKSKKRNRKDD